MSKTYNILIVDDHPLIANAYKSAFDLVSSENEEVDFNITIVENCDDAVEEIEEAVSNKKGIDIALLDISLPPSSDGKILSGEDLGTKLRKDIPTCKIVISTTFNDNFRIQVILKSVNPNGFLIKNDITKDELIVAVKSILEDTPYYSKSVLELFRKQNSVDYKLDKIDRQLIYEMSIGTKMKDLPTIIPMSLAGLEKRKKQLKILFEADGDRELILKAKEKGFV
ncbi:DNA-binding response regulator, NarL/FixJ family, contains REC and HTH domains [Lutibacter oricola]|uniref:DNA-binding response regulator, NarL/FixJ family, contains REC and HTH domains n=1 Tax=Lutibacter oricola TaxID=762486 RepID=A0A1H3D5I3_9FLAO|nr:response regulator [Lutibacter oricola]SDX61647.1 DNA-binding response regulator, NarL/FixJ family, contains REC and HTH domains [Lutibacter oricola]